MPDLIDTELSRAALWGGAAPMQDPRGLAALANFAAAREHANAQVAAAGAQAAGRVSAADLASAAHERSAREVANIQAGALQQRTAQEAQNELARAATARYAAEDRGAGTQEYSLAAAAKLRGEMADKTATAEENAYKAGAQKVFGLKNMTQMTPAQTKLYEEHKGNLGNLQNAWEGHQWWETHASPENVEGFLSHAKSQGASLTPQTEALFRARITARDPEIRSHFGPAMEEYVKNRPAAPNYYQ